MEAASAYRHRRLRIGALLLRSGLLSADKLAEALEEKEQTGERLGEIVVRRGWVTEAQVAELLADQSDLPFVSLSSTPPEARVESLLSSRVAAYFHAVPIRFVDEQTVLVAVADPTSVSTEDLQSAIGLDVRFAVATESEIKSVLATLDPSLPAEPEPAEEDRPELGSGDGEPETGAGIEAPQAEETTAAETDEHHGDPSGGPDASEPGQLQSIVVIVPEQPGSGAEPPVPAANAEVEEPTSATAADSTEELIAIVELPEALRGDPIEPAVGIPVDLLPPPEDPVAGIGLSPEEPGLPLVPGPAAADLSMVEPLSEIPLLRVAGPPREEAGPEPADTAELVVERPAEAGPESAEESRGEIWLPPGALSPPGEVAVTEIDLPSDEPVADVGDAEPPAAEAAPEPDADEPEASAGSEPAAQASAGTPVDASEPARPVEIAEPEPFSQPIGPASAGPDEPEGALLITPAAESDAEAHGYEGEPEEHDAPEAQAPALHAIETSLYPSSTEELGEPDATSVVQLFEHRRPQLGMILLRQGLVTAERLAVGLEENEVSGERLGQILVRTGVITEQGLAAALAEQHSIDYVDIASSPPNVAVASLLPEKYARRYRAVPVRYLDGGALLVAVADPTDVLASDDLRLVLGVQIQLAVAVGSDIDAVLARVHPEGAIATASPPSEPGDDESDGETAPLGGFRRQGPVEVLEATTNAPAIELVNEVIKHAIQEGASDVHFEPQSERMVVRARIDGVMRETRIIPSRLQQAVSARLKIMGELDIAERRAPQDGRVTITFGGRPVDLRIAVLPTLHGEQIVIRILYRSSNAVDLADLGLATDTEAAIRHAIAQPYGALLSVGPTGSGKTTTLYSALRLLNTEDRCVMTIEDPVEYQLDGLNQIQVNVKAGLTFAHGLRTILRSDPDVLLVGEIRDSETAKIAVQAAMTGHLVLSTVHADNVGSAVSRLTDMGVERQLLASTLNVILAQRLARKLCSTCREPFQIDPGLLLKAGADERTLPGDGPVTLFKPRGCGQCLGGYKGRIGLFETLLVTPKMRRLMETATAEEIYEVAAADGMRTLQDDGLRLCIEGLTSLDEVKRVAGERRI